MSEPGAKTPLRRSMREPLDEAVVDALWHRVAERRIRRNAQRSVIAAWAITGAAVLALGVALLARATHDRAPQPASAGATGPARLDGVPLSRLEVAPTAPQPRHARLDDGSVITLAPGAAISAVSNRTDELGLFLELGRVELDVVPGGTRRWTIECGLARVEVIGTKLVIDRAIDRLTISVKHGAVLVQSDALPDRARRLRAGETLAIDAGSALDRPPSEPHASIDRDERDSTKSGQRSSSPEQRVPISAPRVALSPDAASASELPAVAPAPASAARDGGLPAAPDSPVASEPTKSEHRWDEILRAVDEARIAGRASDAASLLESFLAENPQHPSAPLAAFTLGKLELDPLGRPDRAALAFDRALLLGVPRAIEEDTLARLVEARAKAGDLEAARAAAREYEHRYSQSGRWASHIREWIRAR